MAALGIILSQNAPLEVESHKDSGGVFKEQLDV